MEMTGRTGSMAIYMIIIAVAILVIGTAIFAAGSKAVTGTVSVNFEELTEKTAINMYNELLLISTVEQGVKYYDTKDNFIIKLNSTHLEVSYRDDTDTIADTEENTYVSVWAHNLDNIKDVTLDAPSFHRVCISRKIISCKPEISMCIEGDPCCLITPNPCKAIR